MVISLKFNKEVVKLISNLHTILIVHLHIFNISLHEMIYNSSEKLWKNNEALT
jgi:hypothetical protein